MFLSIDGLQLEVADVQVTVLSVLDDDGFDQLTRALAEAGRERIIVLYDPGSVGVARALATNQPPSASVTAWKRRANKILAVYLPNRHRAVLASAAAVNAEPKLLSKYFKLTDAVTEAPATPPWSAWQLALANQAIAADAEAVLLDRELAAAALPAPPVPSDIDAAFTELQAEAAIRALLGSQLANLRKEASEHYLRAAAAETSQAGVAEKPEPPQQPAPRPLDDVVESPSGEKEDSAANSRIAGSQIGQIVMEQYLSLIKNDYGHLYISLYDAQDGDTSWEHLKFKFCSWKGQEYLEFRSGPGLPPMFQSWAGEREDQFGPYLNYPDPNSGVAVELAEPRDRKMLRLIFNILEQVVEIALSSANVEEADRSAWLEKATRWAAAQREATAAWDVGENIPSVTTAG